MPQQHLSAFTEFLLGGATGLLDCVLFHWIDTLKVRRQDNRPLLMDTAGKPLQLQRLGAPRFAVAALRSLYAGFTTNLQVLFCPLFSYSGARIPHLNLIF